MKKLIYIKDVRFQKKVSLKMLLDDIGSLGNDYLWSVLELEAEGDLGDAKAYIDIDNGIKSQNGYCLTWDKLNELAAKFDQVINIIIVAGKDVNFIAAHKSDLDNMHRSFPLIISILDGDFWELVTSDDNLVDRIKSRYEHVDVQNI
jgi:hypothetical protein